MDLYRHVKENCKHLNLSGLMTIGKFGHDYTLGPNPDFLCLIDCHNKVCNELGLPHDQVHISMGMSDDFEQAVSTMASLHGFSTCYLPYSKTAKGFKRKCKLVTLIVEVEKKFL